MNLNNIFFKLNYDIVRKEIVISCIWKNNENKQNRQTKNLEENSK